MIRMSNDNSRIVHIDALRGLAVLLMVMVHAAATWNPYSNTQTSVLAYIVSGLGGLAAPLFITLLGWGLLKANLTLPQRFIRAGFLFACQFLVNVVSSHLFEPFTPGVLSLMALLILTEPVWMYPLRYNRLSVHAYFLSVFTAVLTLTFLAPGLQGVSSWDARVATSSMTEFAAHLVLTGTYPLHPWILFAAFGASISALPSREHRRPAVMFVALGLVYSGILLIYAWQNKLAWALPSGKALLTFFPANGPFLVASLTGVILLWMVVSTHLHFQWMAQTGRCSLTVYVMHFLPFSLLHGIDERYTWSLTESMLVTFCYTLLWAMIATQWYKRYPSKTLESLMRSLEANIKMRQQNTNDES